MNPEQAMVFGNPDSPVYMLGSFEVCQAVMVDQPKVSKAFRNGGAAGYHERCNCLFSGMSRFFGVSYKAHLVQEWLPALDGVVEKLKRGATVADIGCGHGISTILMAKAFERSRFFGIDNQRRFHRLRPRRGGTRRRSSQDRICCRHRQEFCGQRLRPDLLLRCAARSRRSRRRGTPDCGGSRTRSARSWRWSHVQATGWRTISIRSAGSTTPAPP